MPQLTKKEKLANEKEDEIEAWVEREQVAARLAFNEATRAAWLEYEAVWKPAKEKWEAFSKPFFAKLTSRLRAIEKELSEKLGEVRKDWSKCPKCGVPTARFQVFCSEEKCGVNLLTWGKKKK